MTLSTVLMRRYFNLVYNPVYDFAIARLNIYRKLQEFCVDKLTLEDNDKILCVGIGTGNEVSHIIRMNKNISIVGVDYSTNALRKAYKKALAMGKEIQILPMDVCQLELPDMSFDKILCIHVMDFIKERDKATVEILRVLKDGGQFAITYPSEKEDIGMGINVLSDSIKHRIDSGHHRIIAVLQSIAQLLTGIVYLPLFLRPKRVLSRRELHTLFNNLQTEKLQDLQIEEFPLYNDFIAYGKK